MDSKTITSYVIAIFTIVLTGCNGRSVDETCALFNRGIEYGITITNNTKAKVYYSKISRKFSLEGKPKYNIGGPDFADMTDKNLITNSGKVYTSLINHCEGLGAPPDDGMTYDVFLFKITTAGEEDKHFVAVGGSKEDYEAFIPLNNKYTIPDNTQILGYNYVFLPGKQLRERLGLQVTYPRNWEVYTYLDPQKRAYTSYYPGYEFHLIITINGTNAEDIVFAHTGRLHSETISPQQQPATNLGGHSGSSQ